MVSWWRMGVATHRALARTATGAMREVATSSAQAAARPGRRARWSGVLVPGDPPPASARASWLDYRGIALPKHLPDMSTGEFSLGEAIDPQTGRGRPTGLYWDQLVRHTAVIGPSGSGKSRNIFVPWVVAALRLGFSVVSVDTRGDLLNQVVAAASEGTARGVNVPVYPWDVFDARSRPWNPLSEVRDDSHISQVVTAVLGEVDTPRDQFAFFAERDERWLRGLIRLGLAVDPQLTFTGLYALIVDQRRLVRCAQAAPSAAGEVLDLVQFPVDQFSTATSGLANRVAVFTGPAAATVTARSDFMLSDFLRDGGLLVVGGRLSLGGAALAPASVALNLLKMRVLERFGTAGRPMLWILDEVPVYASRIALEQLLDVVRGADVGVVLGAQDVTQFGDSTAVNRRLANCGTVAALRGCSAATADFMAARFGTHDVGATSIGSGVQARPTPTFARQRTSVLGSREIMYPPAMTYGGVAHSMSVHDRPFLFRFA